MAFTVISLVPPSGKFKFKFLNFSGSWWVPLLSSPLDLWFLNYNISTLPQTCKSWFSPQLKAKETKVMQESEGEEFGDFVAYSLLAQRHLREAVTLLQECHRLRNAALRSQQEGTGLEHLVEGVKFSLFCFLKIFVGFFWGGVYLKCSNFGSEPAGCCCRLSGIVSVEKNVSRNDANSRLK